jgi:hypothetical protein
LQGRLPEIQSICILSPARVRPSADDPTKVALNPAGSTWQEGHIRQSDLRPLVANWKSRRTRCGLPFRQEVNYVPVPAEPLGAVAAVAHLRSRGLKISKRQLEEHRRRKTGPIFTRGVRNQALYDPADLGRWAAEQRCVAVTALDRHVIPSRTTSAELIDIATAAALIERRLDGIDLPAWLMNLLPSGAGATGH